MSVRILHGDMLAVLPTLGACSIDSCVTDPPYHLTSIVKRFGAENAAPAISAAQRRFAKTGGGDRLPGTDQYGRLSKGFMGKVWDGGDIASRVETWAEVYRVLKPGAHLLAFGGTRTFHRMACAIEDAGFEIRDTMSWLYGSGFPKSLDISKAIDRAAGVEREVVPIGDPVKRMIPGADQNKDGWAKDNGREYVPNISAAATEDAKRWQGWGTALKPAMELICVARKPLGESTVAANVLRYGCGGLNVDGCRVAVADVAYTKNCSGDRGHEGNRTRVAGFAMGCGRASDVGRWPANVCHDGSEEVLQAFPATASGGAPTSGNRNGEVYGDFEVRSLTNHGANEGSAARFFYAAKADKTDRLASKHPTVKPVDLIRYLVRLVTPPGGTVLDCFAGSGTLGMAALAEGFNAVLIEREAEYVADIQRRLDHVEGADTPLFAQVTP